MVTKIVEDAAGREELKVGSESGPRMHHSVTLPLAALALSGTFAAFEFGPRNSFEPPGENAPVATKNVVKDEVAESSPEHKQAISNAPLPAIDDLHIKPTEVDRAEKDTFSPVGPEPKYGDLFDPWVDTVIIEGNPSLVVSSADKFGAMFVAPSLFVFGAFMLCQLRIWVRQQMGWKSEKEEFPETTKPLLPTNPAPAPTTPAPARTAASLQVRNAESSPPISTDTEIFRERIKGIDIVIKRGAHGDTMRLLAGKVMLLEITASQISKASYSDSDLMLQGLAEGGTKIGNYQASAFVCKAELHLAVELHPLRIPRSLADAGKLALTWLGLLAQLPVSFTESRTYFAEGDEFREVRYRPSFFGPAKEPVQLP